MDDVRREVSVPGAVLWPLPRGVELRIELSDPPPTDPDLDEAIESHWAQLQRGNPRDFDGSILRIDSVHPAAGLIAGHRGRYRDLAVADRLDADIRHLGVNGVVIGADASGAQHVLLGRRGTQTRIYGGLWELAPAGGVEPPPPPPPRSQDASQPARPWVVSSTDIVRKLIEEAQEETGLHIDPAWCRIGAIVRDLGPGRHDNAVVLVDLPEPVDPRRTLCAAQDWEYLDLAWVSRADCPAFVRDNAAAIIPPTIATLAWLGWSTP